MANDPNPGGGPPSAIERSRLILLPVCQKTVEVRRWSFTRLMQISKYMNEIISELPEDVVLNSHKAVSFFFEHSAVRMLEVVKLSLAPEHREIVNDELDAEDAFRLIQEAFDLNDANDSLKKATSLAGSFLLGRKAAKVQQASETIPMAATTDPKAS